MGVGFPDGLLEVEKTNPPVHLILPRGIDVARVPSLIATDAEPLKRTRWGIGVAGSLVEDGGAVALVDKVDEEGAAGRRVGVA